MNMNECHLGLFISHCSNIRYTTNEIVWKYNWKWINRACNVKSKRQHGNINYIDIRAYTKNTANKWKSVWKMFVDERNANSNGDENSSVKDKILQKMSESSWYRSISVSNAILWYKTLGCLNLMTIWRIG